MPHIEQSVLRTLPWVGAGLVASLPLLLIDTEGHLEAWFLVHLSAIVTLGLVIAFVIEPLADAAWFVDTGWPPRMRLIASGASAVALTTGAVALVTLASSAAMRYDPSTQFLQLLSALDIAWAGAAILVGAARIGGRRWGAFAGIVLGVVCVWSIWNYLHTVGFGPNGEWIVSGSDLMRLVIPYDMAAAAIAVAVFLIGVVRADQPTEQASPQS